MKEYKDTLLAITDKIDDQIIREQKHIHSEYKLFILGKKHGINPITSAIRHGARYYIENGTCVYDYSWGQKAVFEILEIQGKQLTIEGHVNGILFPDVKFGLSVGGKFTEAESVKRPRMERRFLGDELVFDHNCFRITIDISHGDNVSSVIKFADGTIRHVPVSATPLTRLQPFIGRPYRVQGDFIIAQVAHSRFVFLKKTSYMWLKKEIKYLFHSFSSLKTLRKRKLSTIALRLAYYISKPHYARKKIWLFSDRINAAGDNGEALFRYFSAQDNKDIRGIFAISRSAKEYETMKRVGEVVDRNSWKYKLLFLHSSKVISSHADRFVIEPFYSQHPFLIDLFQFDYVFLQHGITKDDISGWINKYQKNIKLLVTASDRERDSMLNNRYSYDSSVVVATGFPRYDLLQNEAKNKLIIAPTWRQFLASKTDEKHLLHTYQSEFKRSDYYKFYNGLLNDPRILHAIDTHNIRAEFYLHPALSHQAPDFSSDKVTIMTTPYDYKKVFREGSLLLTDYSSVFFDFAYLKKPVIYSQFDRDKIFNGHIGKEGYFSYEDDGFGPVTTDYESTVRQILTYIENGYKMEEKYQKRVDDFFAWTDKNNSQRVYDKIRELDNTNGDIT